MEQRQNDLRASQGVKMNLARTRAMEKFEKHPQLAISSEIIPTEEQVVNTGGSIDSRMKRVIGSGKKKGKGVLQITHGGAVSGSSDGVMRGGAYGEGMKLAKHLETLHGAGWLSDFWEGVKSVVKPIANVASFIPGPIGTIGKVASGVMGLGVEDKETKRFVKKLKGGYGGTTAPPAGIEVENAVADSQLAPNVVPSSVYGNTPQPSPAFIKNMVGMGSHMEGGMKKQKRAPSARNMKISQLMKGSGMTLAQASKYLKDHPDE